MLKDVPDIADIGIGYWKKERPGIDCRRKAIAARILHLNEMMITAMNANLARFGIKYSSYAILATLRSVGKPYSLSPTQLQNTLMITSGGVSNLIRKVETAGYVTRQVKPNDGRGIVVELTDVGFKLTEGTMVAQAEIERHLHADPEGVQGLR